MNLPPQPSNPTTVERLRLLRYGLEINERPEDFDHIVNLLSPPSEITSIVPPGSCKGIKVAVLGGGLAGLSAAFELRKLGFDITIYEAEDERIGGRVYTHYFDRRQQFYGELGPFRFPVGHITTWHYIDLFNLPTRPFIGANENAFRYVRDIRSRNTPEAVQNLIYPAFDLTPEERNTLWPELEARVSEDYLSLMSPEVRSELLKILENYSLEINKTDYTSFHQAMQNANLSDGAIEMLTSVVPFFGGFIDASHFAILQDIYPLNFSFTYELIGGLVNLPMAFYNSLINSQPQEYGPVIPPQNLGRINFNLGHQITGLSQQEGFSVTVHYKTKTSPINQEELFDFVICSIPFSNLRLLELNPIFSSSKMQAIRLLNMSAAQKTVFLCNRRFWEEGRPDERIIGGASSTDLVINGIWYPSELAESPNAPGVITASYNYTQDAVRLGNFKEEDIPEIIKRQIEEVHGLPKYSLDSIVVDYKTLLWNNHPWALGAFTFMTPKQNNLFAKVSIEPEYCNRVFFAGEHTSNAKGWMQGALQTGMMAANGIAMECSQYI